MILHADCPGESWFLAGGLFHFKKETTTLEMLNETSDIAFKAYLTRKIQGCFRRWGLGRDEPQGVST